MSTVPAPASSQLSLAGQVGFWSALLVTLWAVAFTIAAIATAILYPSPQWRGIVDFAAHYDPTVTLTTELPCVFLALSFVMLMASIHSVTPDDRKVLSLIGLAFTLMYAAVLAASYYLQLTAVRQSLLHGETDGLAPFVLVNPHSIVWAWESFGYGMMCLATLAIAPLFRRDGLAHWIQALLMVNGAIGVFDLALPLLDAPLVFTAIGGAAWAVVFPAATILLAVWFRRLESLGPETGTT